VILIIKKILYQIIYIILRFISNFNFINNKKLPIKGTYEDIFEAISEIDNSKITTLSNEKLMNLSPHKLEFSDSYVNLNFKNPKLFVAEFQNARVLSDYGIVLTPNHKLIHEVSPYHHNYSKYHPAMFKFKFQKIRKLKGKFAVLTTGSHQRYYHWLFDILPRFNILDVMKTKVDGYIINNKYKFQKEYLDLIGINENKIISPKVNGYIEIENLVVPSLPGNIGIPTLKSCEYLRNKFSKYKQKYDQKKRLYLSRKDALTRRVLNEVELIETLKYYNFEFIELSNISIKDQINLFSNSEIIVGPHGGAFSNIVFCEENTNIIEFMPVTYTSYCFLIISKLISLNHKILQCKTIYNKPSRKNFKIYNKHDIYVDIGQFLTLLSALHTTS